MVIKLAEFFSRGAFAPTKIELFYLGVLVIYSLHKEMVRWLGERKVERQGECFVYIWVGLTTALYLINFFTNWMGDDGFLWKMSGDERVFNQMGDITTFEGRVIKKLYR